MDRIDRAYATDIMLTHSHWALDAERFRVCTGHDCGFRYSRDYDPTQLDVISHQIRSLEEAGFDIEKPSAEIETIETPGMVRWVNGSHYFLKRIGTSAKVHKPNTFVLGLEHRFGDNAYSYSCGIEFDNDEAPDLMDRIAKFNDLPTYTELLEVYNKTKKLYDEEEPSAGIPEYHIFDKLKAILKGVK